MLLSVRGIILAAHILRRGKRPIVRSENGERTLYRWRKTAAR